MQASLIVAVIGVLATLGRCHAVRQIESGEKEIVSGYVNQARTVPIPFEKCFKVEAEL